MKPLQQLALNCFRMLVTKNRYKIRDRFPFGFLPFFLAEIQPTNYIEHWRASTKHEKRQTQPIEKIAKVMYKTNRSSITRDQSQVKQLTKNTFFSFIQHSDNKLIITPPFPIYLSLVLFTIKPMPMIIKTKQKIPCLSRAANKPS